MPIYKIFINASEDNEFPTKLSEHVSTGDELYIVSNDNLLNAGSIDYATSSPQLLGTVSRVGPQAEKPAVGLSAMTANEIQFSSANESLGETFLNGGYIMCSKNKVVNKSGIKGYYAEVKMEHDSTSEVELFAVSSEIFESSK